MLKKLAIPNYNKFSQIPDLTLESIEELLKSLKDKLDSYNNLKFHFKEKWKLIMQSNYRISFNDSLFFLKIGDITFMEEYFDMNLILQKNNEIFEKFEIPEYLKSCLNPINSFSNSFEDKKNSLELLYLQGEKFI